MQTLPTRLEPGWLLRLASIQPLLCLCLLSVQVAQLESLAPAVPSELEGRWELLYSDVAPFRVSPFFLTVRPTRTSTAPRRPALTLSPPPDLQVGKLFGDAQASEDFFRLHRLATSSGEIGKVSQLITKMELVSEVRPVQRGRPGQRGSGERGGRG